MLFNFLVINVDKNAAYSPAIEEIKKSSILSNECELRYKKYFNNAIEQDRGSIEKLANYKSYFQYFHTAWKTLRGYEIEEAMSKVASKSELTAHSYGEYHFSLKLHFIF